METQLIKPLDSEGLVYEYRFRGVANCTTLVAIPIGSTLFWEILQCLLMLELFDFDLFSVTAFPKRIEEGSNTAIRAIDLAVTRHAIEKIVVVQTADYHHYTGGRRRFTDSIKEDANHKMALIGCSLDLKRRHENLETLLVYGRIIDGRHISFSLIEEGISGQ